MQLSRGMALVPDLVVGVRRGVGLGQRVALARPPEEGLHLAPRPGPVQHPPRQVLCMDGHCSSKACVSARPMIDHSKVFFNFYAGVVV